MTTAEDSVDDASTALVPTGRGERRARHWCLWGLVLALPATFLITARANLEDWWQRQELFEVGVSAGTAAHFAGADWKLETVEVLPLKESGWPRVQRQGTPVRVRFQVIVREPNIDVLWRGCQVALQDGQGRRWAAGGFDGPRSTEGTTTCGAATLEPRAPGTVLRIEQDFTVLHDVAGTVEPTVSMDGERPRYLHFSLESQ
jgi:hypothetical protein